MVYGLAFLVTLALCPVVLVALRRLHVLDVPSERSSHVVVTPRGGGLAIAIGTTAGVAASGAFGHRQHAGFVVAALLFGGIGLVDDLSGVPPLRRLILQFVVAAAASPFVLAAAEVGGVLTILVGALVVVWIVAFVNAFNFMDGINGISVAQTVVAGLAFFCLGQIEDLPLVGTAGLAAAAAAAAFAPFNAPKAQMFLGDVGSYFIGAFLAGLAAVAWIGGAPLEAVLAPLSIYLVDSGTTLLRRVHQGTRWYAPHREHVYQKLVQLGWSHVRTTGFVAVLMVVASALGGLALTDSFALRVLGDMALAGVLLAYLAAPRWLARTRSPVLLPA